MLHDRDYMRSLDPDARRPLTIKLIILLVGLFVGQVCLRYIGGRDFYVRFLEWFALSLGGIEHGRVWQLFTFQFLHDVPSPLHVFFNCLALYFFGRTIEQTLGRTRFVGVYLASGFLGGTLQVLLAWIFHQTPENTVVGASAGVMGLIGAFATLYPMREMTVLVYFFPVTIRAKYFLWAALIYSIYGILVPFDNTAQAAHLGGLLTGVAYIHWMSREKGQSLMRGWWPARRRKRELIKAAVVRPPRTALDVRDEPREELPSGEFISKEVDPILEKISAHGIQSLTERERKILQAARAKMSKP